MSLVDFTFYGTRRVFYQEMLTRIEVDVEPEACISIFRQVFAPPRIEDMAWFAPCLSVAFRVGARDRKGATVFFVPTGIDQ